jgi:hypothetical protein
VAVSVKDSSSHITFLSLDKVALGSPKIPTYTSLDVDEHAVGSGLTPTKGLS